MDKYAFGNYLTDLRTQRGLSQSELGEIVGVSNKAISKWENGEALPRLERLKKLADYFGVPVEELVAGGKRDEDAPGAEPDLTPHFGRLDAESVKQKEQEIAAYFACQAKREFWGKRLTLVLLIAWVVSVPLAYLPRLLLAAELSEGFPIVLCIVHCALLTWDAIVIWRGVPIRNRLLLLYDWYQVWHGWAVSVCACIFFWSAMLYDAAINYVPYNPYFLVYVVALVIQILLQLVILLTLLFYHPVREFLEEQEENYW